MTRMQKTADHRSQLFFLGMLLLGCQKPVESNQNLRGTSASRLPLQVTSQVQDNSAGAAVTLPLDLSNLAGQLKIEEGASVVSEGVTTALSIPQGSSSAGPSVNISSQASISPSQIGRLEISIPYSAGLGLNASFLVVLYQVTDADGKILYGVIPPSSYRLDEGKIKFKMQGFGNYQAARIPLEIKEEVKVKTEDTKILTKVQEAVTALRPIFSQAAGSYTSVFELSLSSATAGATIYYTRDGTAPSTTSPVYSSPLLIGAGQTSIKAIAAKEGLESSDLASAVYTVTLLPVEAVSFNPAAGSYTADFTVTLASATADAQIYYTTDGSEPNATSTLYTAPIPVAGVGSALTIKALAVKSGWASSAAVSASYQIPAPSISVDAGADSRNNVALQRTALATGTVNSWAWSKVSGPGNLTFSAPSSATTTISADADGSYVIRVDVVGLGNVAAADQFEMIWDQTAPSLGTISLAGGALNSFLNATEKTAASELIAAPSLEAGGTLGYALAPAASSCNAALTYAAAIPQSNAASLTSDGSYKVCVRAQDTAGNSSYASSPTFLLDTVSAAFTSISLATPVADGYLNLSERTGSVDLVTSLVATDAYAVAYDLTAEAAACETATAYNTLIPKTDDNRLTGSGNYKVCVRVQDEAGNVPVYGQSGAFAYSSAAPVFTSLARTGAADDGYLNSEELSATGALWTLTASGASSIDYSAPQADPNNNLSCNGSQSYSQGSNPPTPAVFSSLSDGRYRLCVKLIDAAGNITYGTSDSVIRDVLAPTIDSFTLVNEAANGFVNNITRTSTENLVVLSSADATLIEYSAATSDAGACDGTRSFSSTAPLISSLSSEPDDSYKVCGRIRDDALNATYSWSPAVVKDTVAPTFTSADRINGASDGIINSSEAASNSPAWQLNASGHSQYWVKGAQIDNSNSIFCEAGAGYSAGPFATIDQLNADGKWIQCVKLMDDAGNDTYGKSLPIVRDATAPAAPSGFTGVGAANYIDLQWTAVTTDTEGYLLVRGPTPGGAAPSFVPVTGTPYTVGSQGSDAILSVTHVNSKADGPHTLQTEVSYRLYAYDAAKNYSSPADLNNMKPSAGCPAGWIHSKGDSEYGTRPFCVMPYEAKDVGGSPDSQAAQTPWVSVKQRAAKFNCEKLGPGYYLLSNMEWMTLGTDIAAVNSNWTNNAVGNGKLMQGHSDNTPNVLCPVPTDTSLTFASSSSTCNFVASDSDAAQRRTFHLGNGQVIWDLAGNAAEWVDYTIQYDKPGIGTSLWQLLSLGTGSTTLPADYLTPTQAKKSFWINTWDANQGIGVYKPGTDNALSGLVRGGNVSSFGDSGLFYADLELSPDATAANLGFRCSKRLADADAATLSLLSYPDSIQANWSRPGGYSDSLLVLHNPDTVPQFSPETGASYIPGTYGDVEVLMQSSDSSFTHTSLTAGTRYDYSIYSIDSSGNYAPPVRGHETPLSCPSGYALVQGMSLYGTQDYCVMRYEASMSGSVAQSIPSTAPTPSYSQDKAKTSCQALGFSYDLINNDEWMTMTAVMAAQGTNWSSGTMNSGAIYRGHTDNTPPEACPAHSDDTMGYLGATCPNSSTMDGSNPDQKRTLVLPSGGIMWDVSGNLAEWVDAYNATDKPNAGGTAVEFSSLTNSTSWTKERFVPIAFTQLAGANSWSSSKGIGNYTAGTTNSGGGLLRGGKWSDGSSAGIFAANLSFAPTISQSSMGFRCVMRR